MSDSDARTGFDALLQRQVSGGGTPTYADILGIKSISGPSITRDTHDTTTMTSENFREYIGGLADAGEVSFSANWLPRDPTQGQEVGGFMAEFDKGSCASRGRWRIVIPGCPGEPEVYLEFDGIVTGQNIDIPLDDLMSFEGTIKVSGRPLLIIEDVT